MYPTGKVAENLFHPYFIGCRVEYKHEEGGIMKKPIWTAANRRVNMRGMGSWSAGADLRHLKPAPDPMSIVQKYMLLLSIFRAIFIKHY
jgi:hypothetical protein